MKSDTGTLQYKRIPIDNPISHFMYSSYMIY